jgi:formylglycine-generating enzyme required for sulfatase activity
MVSLGPSSPDNDRACIDQFEFPNAPCEFPLVWSTPFEAAALCKAVGKRLCDAHEWEGACAGRALTPDQAYAWSSVPRSLKHATVRERRLFLEHHNNERRELVWAYGKGPEPDLCAIGSSKSASCTHVDYDTCGSNTYPSGSFPGCVSGLGVYDQHGNVAEHMSLPLSAEEMGGKGWTEMKGSWFIFAHSPTHADDCRWRARNWHTTRIDSPGGHRSYHLGFRCCRDIAK